MNIITIDTGTTNTRIKLFNEERFVDGTRLNVGVRDTLATGSTQLLRLKLHEGIRELLSNNKLITSDVECVIASGMICSDIGLHCILHVAAPVDEHVLAENSHAVYINDVIDAPILFVPGVKNNTTLCDENLDEIDMMRGEETEFIGIAKICAIDRSAIGVLPGSHTKLIQWDGTRILSCSTMMSGELLNSVCTSTILKKSLPEQLNSRIDDEYLIFGCEYAKKYGYNKAMFKVRILDIMLKTSIEKIYSFYVGATLCGDVAEIARVCGDKPIYVGGGEPLRAAFGALLKHSINNEIYILNDDIVDMSTSVGALAVYNMYRNNQH